MLFVSGLDGQAQSTSSSAQFAAPAATQTSVTPAAQVTAAPPQTSAVEAQPPDALARKYIELWNTGDPEQIKTFPPFVMNSVAGRVVVNPGMLKSVITNWRKSMPDLNFQVKDTVVQGEKVAMRVVFTGTYKARLFPFTADPKSVGPDRRIRATDMIMFQVKDGKVVEIWEEYDVGLVQAQMGGKWCTDVMSTAAPPLGSTASPQPAPGSANPAPPSPKP